MRVDVEKVVSIESGSSVSLVLYATLCLWLWKDSVGWFCIGLRRKGGEG